ncbi:MAG TPA: CheR family methyltransferase [Pseudobacteroides sp.]|uniref:CheR family methyltransferase n=1 Tax=Pseudobacteroides sp. TaxID=1968840 RepID=UPI002F953588
MKPITEKEFNQLVDIIKSKYGVNLLNKKALVIGRLQNYTEQNGFKSFSEYLAYVLTDKTGRALTTLINKVTTNHTFFMREAEHFSFFQNKVLPYLEATESAKKDLRIWSAGCSTGEEPYTLAMIVDEHFGLEKNLWDTIILATDISTKVLETACNGVYPNELIEVLPQKWKNNYFVRVNEENSKIISRLKDDVIFKKFNLMQDIFPFRRKFHVIFCRNVMIYFDLTTRTELVNKFYEFMEQGGYLFIGHSESLNREETRFKYILPAVYRKE